MPHLLIIEDDPDLGPLLKLNLEREGYRVTLCPNGRLGMSESLRGSADLIILDLMLPLMDGMTILQRMREELISTPVIILSAKGTEKDKLTGFRAGCDDYVCKPFSLMELISRVRAVLKRSGFINRPSVLHFAELMIDPVGHTVEKSGESIRLSPREFDLLYELASHHNQALSRTHLLDEIWGEDSDVTVRTVDNHITSLRKKLDHIDETRRITTVYKLGYRWED